MKTFIVAIMTLVAILAKGGTIPVHRVTNEYLAITIPSGWKLEVVAGKEGEMQMSLWIPDNGTNRLISLFAYWGGLDPRKWIGRNVVSQYKLDGREYFLKEENGRKDLEIIVQGRRFVIWTSVDLGMQADDLALLLNSLNTLKPN